MDWIIRWCVALTGGLAAFLLWVILAAPASALVYAPGQDSGGYIHLTYQEVAERVKELIADPSLRGAEMNVTFNEDETKVLSGTPYWLLIEAGFSEYFVSRFDTVLRYDDPFWAVKVAEHPTLTEWQYSYSLTR